MQRTKDHWTKSRSVAILWECGGTQRFGLLWPVLRLEERGTAGDWGMLDWRWVMGRDMVDHQQWGRYSCSLKPWLEKT